MNSARMVRQIMRRMKPTAAGVEAEIPGLVGKKITADSPEALQVLANATYGPEAAQKAATNILAKDASEVSSARIKADKAREAIANPEDITEKIGLVGKVGKLASAPQRAILSKLANKLGRNVSGQDSQEASEAMVEAAAEKLGLGDSDAANMVKAAGVAGLEVFADPLSLVPVGKLASFAPKAAKLAEKVPMLKKALPSIEKAVRKARLESLLDITKKRKSFADTLVEQGATPVKATHIVKARP